MILILLKAISSHQSIIIVERHDLDSKSLMVNKPCLLNLTSSRSLKAHLNSIQMKKINIKHILKLIKLSNQAWWYETIQKTNSNSAWFYSFEIDMNPKQVNSNTILKAP